MHLHCPYWLLYGALLLSMRAGLGRERAMPACQHTMTRLRHARTSKTSGCAFGFRGSAVHVEGGWPPCNAANVTTAATRLPLLPNRRASPLSVRSTGLRRVSWSWDIMFSSLTQASRSKVMHARHTTQHVWGRERHAGVHTRLWLTKSPSKFAADIIMLGDAMEPFHSEWDIQGLSDWIAPELPSTGLPVVVLCAS